MVGNSGDVPEGWPEAARAESFAGVLTEHQVVVVRACGAGVFHRARLYQTKAVNSKLTDKKRGQLLSLEPYVVFGAI